MSDRASKCVLLLALCMVFLALTPVADLEGIATQSTAVVAEPEKHGMRLAGIPHCSIAIDGDANFSDTALLEGWPGDGSLADPYIIDRLEIDLSGGEGSCISIRNTRVSFTVRKCNLTSAMVGIYLKNVTHCKLVNNTCNNNGSGITIHESDHNTVVNNICSSNDEHGIHIDDSHHNTVANNTCTSNGEYGIRLDDSHFNTVANNTCTSNTVGGIHIDTSDSNNIADNTCKSNGYGIKLRGGSNSNTVTNNVCNNNNEHGILLEDADNTVANNTCTSNNVGISLELSFDESTVFNTVSNNICSNNTESGIELHDSVFSTLANNVCNNNRIGICLYDSDSNTLVKNTCNNNGIGIYLYLSHHNNVTHNTCLSNTEHDIYLDTSVSNTVENNFTTVFYTRLLWLGGMLFMLPPGIVVLRSRWHIALAMIQRTRYRLAFRVGKRRAGHDDIIVPIRYRLVSLLRTRGSITHMVVDEPLEPDSTD